MNKFIINNPFIIHEMVHAHIHEKFGFKKWRILPLKNGLICIMTIPKDALFPKYFPKLLLWNITHLIHDIFWRFFILDIINITGYTKNFILINRRIIKEILKK